MVRAFAAIALPEGQRRRLAPHLADCARAAPDFRWVRAENLHLTLRFAGNLPDVTACRLAAELRRVRRPPFRVRVAGTGAFGGRRPRVVFLRLAEGAHEAAELAAGCERACQAAGLQPEIRPFSAHLTLARARDRSGAPLPDLPDPPELPEWRVDEFVLYRSQLSGAQSPVYESIERYPLLA